MAEQLAIAGFVVYAAAIVVDMVGYLAFWPQAYMLGLRIFHEVRPGSTAPVLMVGSTVETDHGKFRSVSADQVLVRERQRMWDMWRSDVRGSITWGPDGATVEARLPLMMLIVVLLMTGALIVVAASGGPEALIILVVFLAIVPGVTVPRQRHRMRLLLDELERHTTGLWPYA